MVAFRFRWLTQFSRACFLSSALLALKLKVRRALKATSSIAQGKCKFFCIKNILYFTNTRVMFFNYAA